METPPATMMALLLAVLFIGVALVFAAGLSGKFPGLSEWLDKLFNQTKSEDQYFKISTDSAKALTCAINSAERGSYWTGGGCSEYYTTSTASFTGHLTLGETVPSTVTCTGGVCTVKNFRLPQDTDWKEKWDFLGVFGHPKFLVYWQNFPMDEDTWSIEDNWKLATGIVILTALPVGKLFKFGGKIWGKLITRKVATTAEKILLKKLVGKVGTESAQGFANILLHETGIALSKESVEAIAKKGLKEFSGEITKKTIKKLPRSVKKEMIEQLSKHPYWAEQIAKGVPVSKILEDSLKEGAEESISAIINGFKHPIKTGTKIAIRGATGGAAYITLSGLLYWHNIVRLLETRPNNIVLKEPYRDEIELELVDSLERKPVIIDKGGVGGINFAHLVSPCSIDEMKVEKATFSCDQFTYSQKGVTCSEPKEIKQDKDIPLCHLKEIDDMQNEYEALSNNIKISTPPTDLDQPAGLRDFENVPLFNDEDGGWSLSFSFYPNEPEKDEIIFNIGGSKTSLKPESGIFKHACTDGTGSNEYPIATLGSDCHTGSILNGRCLNDITLHYKPDCKEDVWQRIKELSDKIFTGSGAGGVVWRDIKIQFNTVSATDDNDYTENMVGVAITGQFSAGAYCSGELYENKHFPGLALPCTYYMTNIFTDKNNDGKVDDVFVGFVPEDKWSVELIGYEHDFRDEVIIYGFSDTSGDSDFDLYSAGKFDFYGRGYGEKCKTPGILISDVEKGDDMDPNYCFHKEKLSTKILEWGGIGLAVGGVVVAGFFTGGAAWIGAVIATGATIAGAGMELVGIYNDHKEHWPG